MFRLGFDESEHEKEEGDGDGDCEKREEEESLMRIPIKVVKRVVKQLSDFLRFVPTFLLLPSVNISTSCTDWETS